MILDEEIQRQRETLLPARLARVNLAPNRIRGVPQALRDDTYLPIYEGRGDDRYLPPTINHTTIGTWAMRAFMWRLYVQGMVDQTEVWQNLHIQSRMI